MKDSHEVQLGRDLTKTFNRDCHYSVSTLSTFLLYYEFCVLGCQGDRTPMYRAFAPFFEGDKGDRRVTGVCAHSRKMGNITTVCPALIQMTNRCFGERMRLLESNSLENLTLNAGLSNTLGGVNLQILSRI